MYFNYNRNINICYCIKRIKNKSRKKMNIRQNKKDLIEERNNNKIQ